MCGIAGIVDKNHISSINGSTLKKMSDTMISRGPDSSGRWISKNRDCGLAFRRLAIIDLSVSGNQPMTTQDGRYTIVFNGEIYNFKQIRNELRGLGYKFKSQSDTEVLLYAFAEFGADVVEKLVGMWAFAIWDEMEKSIFLCRDRVGIKPLYYLIVRDTLVFASEIKAILEHPVYNRELNLAELPNYLNFGMSGNRESLFKNIKKIPAGCYLKLDKKLEGAMTRYWTPLSNFNGYVDASENELASHTIKLLRRAVKDRMMSDVPFGVFLSGGIDSSLNVALMDELMDRPVDTFSVGFSELEKYNELKFARKIANIYNTNHNEILIDHKDAFSILGELAWREDEPNADPVCMPLYFLSKMTRDSGTVVVQVGEGSDEQFVGYKWMLQLYSFYKTYWKFFKTLPGFARRGVYGLSRSFFEKKNQFLALDYLRRAAYDEQLYWGGVSVFAPTFMEKLFRKDYRILSKIPAEYAQSLHEEALEQYPQADFLQRVAYVELRNRLAEILLMRVDKIGMSHSIEARVPFLDHRLIEFTTSIKPEMKVPEGSKGKHILKKAVEDILPKDIINRKKQGFWAPVNEWLRYRWHDCALAKVMNSYFIKEEIFDKKVVSTMFKMHRDGKRNFGLHLFSLLMLALWRERYFD